MSRIFPEGGGGATALTGLRGAAAGTDMVSVGVQGDANNRLVINADGSLEWGGGAGALDVLMDRPQADRLEILDELWVRPGGAGTHGIVFKAGNTLASEVNVDIPVTFALPIVFNREIQSGERHVEIADPAAPPINQGHLYVRDNGAGKSQLCIRFNTGAIQVIATEP